LDRELEQLELLRELGERERGAIRTLDTQALLAIGTNRMQRLEALRATELERAAVVTQLAAEWALPPEGLTLDDLLDHLEAEAAASVRKRQRRLAHAVDAVRTGIAMNRLLVSRFLTFIREALAACRNLPAQAAIYAPSGELRTAVGRAALCERRG
jgi:hypothetical protein